MFTPKTSLAAVFAVIVSSICAVLGHHAACTRDRALSALLVIAHYRIARMVSRLDALTLRWQQGRLTPPRPSRAGVARTPSAIPRPRLPAGRAWLIRLAQPTAQMAGQIQAFLATPEALALLSAAPQAGRILRPLCRALAIDLPECLRPPGTQAAPAPGPPPPSSKAPAHPRRPRRAAAPWSDPPYGGGIVYPPWQPRSA